MVAIAKSPAAEPRAADRQVSPRAALGIWCAASLGGWLMIAGLLSAGGLI